MPVPFGVGVGDFAVVAKLTGQVVKELKANGEAAPKYQSLLVELEMLGRALSEINKLESSRSSLKHLEAIRAAVRACQLPLEEFLEKISKFESSLGTWETKDKRLRGLPRRLQFNMCFSDDVTELRGVLGSHISTITVLFMVQQLEITAMAETEHARKLGQLQESIQANIELTSSLSQAQNEIKSHFQSREDTVQADMGALVQNMALGSLYPRLRSIMDSYQQLSLSPPPQIDHEACMDFLRKAQGSSKEVARMTDDFDKQTHEWLEFRSSVLESSDSLDAEVVRRLEEQCEKIDLLLHNLQKQLRIAVELGEASIKLAFDNLQTVQASSKNSQAIMVFTTITAIFLPLSFFTSYYGMQLT